ncbi:hypothetical protein E2P63_02870 [Candidatus Bathyarchaeota archaeon]|nr:hypothetical protein E2P63_02870 [Candidatus Bathyarchaeota archaeon]
MIAVLGLIQLFVQPRLEVLIVLAITLYAVLFECSFVGLALSSRYPDFTEVPRARFIDQKGVWLGLIIIACSAVVTFLPLLLYQYSIIIFPLIIASVASAIIGILICYSSYRLTLNSISKLITQN